LASRHQNGLSAVAPETFSLDFFFLLLLLLYQDKRRSKAIRMAKTKNSIKKASQKVKAKTF